MSGPVDVPPAEFRRAIAEWATGVSVVTSRNGGVDTGLTVNALLSVSLTPPLLLISIQHAADSTPIIRQSGVFAVNVLSRLQRPLSERFAQTLSPEEKFRAVPIHRGVTKVPLIEGAVATIECRVRQEIPVADHALFIGEVVSVHLSNEEPPLVFHRSRYSSTNGEPAP